MGGAPALWLLAPGVFLPAEPVADGTVMVGDYPVVEWAAGGRAGPRAHYERPV